jgi:hypothetical protein
MIATIMVNALPSKNKKDENLSSNLRGQIFKEDIRPSEVSVSSLYTK